MNLLQKLMIGAIAAALPASASASTITFHIAGSTAFRAPLSCAIINYLGGTSAHAVYSGSSLLGGLSAVYEGTVGGNTVIVEADWTGSLAGVVDISTQNALTFPNPADSTIAGQLASSASLCTTTASAAPNNKYGGGQVLASGFATTTAPADAVMSDSFYTSIEQAVSAASGIALSGQPGTNTVSPLDGDGLASTIDGAGLVEGGTNSLIASGAQGYLGIVPFEWVLGNTGNSAAQASTAVPFTNITQQTASYLIQNGSAPFTMFGGSSPSTFAFLIGRNEDSGTRVAAFAEPQLGFLPTPNQYLINSFSGTPGHTSAVPAPATNNGFLTGGTTSAITGFVTWTQGTPLNTEPKISWPNNTGHGGYVSGGDVGSILGTAVTQASVATEAKSYVGEDTTGAYFIGYIGIADAGGYVKPGANLSSATDTPKVLNGTCLTYNGVAFSPAAVNNGSYSFWGYEHMYYPDGSGSLTAIGSDQQTIADAIADSVATKYVTYDSGGVDASALSVYDGAGIALIAANSTAAATAGNVTRQSEGGVYSLNY